MLIIDYKARQELKQILHGGTKPKDLSLSVWDALCKGEVATMSSHTLASLIKGFRLIDIKQILEYSDGWKRTVFEAVKIQAALPGTNTLE